jgi:hypothetical protein
MGIRRCERVGRFDSADDVDGCHIRSAEGPVVLISLTLARRPRPAAGRAKPPGRSLIVAVKRHSIRRRRVRARSPGQHCEIDVPHGQHEHHRFPVTPATVRSCRPRARQRAPRNALFRSASRKIASEICSSSRDDAFDQRPRYRTANLNSSQPIHQRVSASADSDRMPRLLRECQDLSASTPKICTSGRTLFCAVAIPAINPAPPIGTTIASASGAYR